MQRNMDLVRVILLRLEDLPMGIGRPNFGIEGFPADWVAYHAHILKESGMVEAVDATTAAGFGSDAVLVGLTWKGHEFLELARNYHRWNRAATIIRGVGGAPIGIWENILTHLMRADVEKLTVQRT